MKTIVTLPAMRSGVLVFLIIATRVSGCSREKQKTPEPTTRPSTVPETLNRTDTFVGNLHYNDYEEFLRALDTVIADTVILHHHNDTLDYANRFRHTFSFVVNGWDHTHSTAIDGRLMVDTTGYPHRTIGTLEAPFLLRNDTLRINKGYHCCQSVGYAEFSGRPLH